MVRWYSAVALALTLAAAGCGPERQQRVIPENHPAPAHVVAPPTTDFTVVATGDFLVQPELAAVAAADAQAAGRPGHDFARILGALKPIVSAADLAICHMETPLAPPGGPFTGYPIFNAPEGLADTTAALGYDTCSTASNHTLDYGEAGVARTLAGLDRVGVGHTGSARTKAEAMTPRIIDVRGVKVGHLSYTFSFNGIERPAGKPWISNLIDPAAILAEARRARGAGAEVVILSAHWGTEYQHEADIGQRGLAEQLLARPEIDLIIGHHAHVVQPFDRFGAKWVAYGIGNVMTRFPDGSNEDTQDALAARFTFTRTGTGAGGAAGWKVTRAEVLPTWMEYHPRPRVVDLAAALASRDISAAQRETYQRAYSRIARWVNARGARPTILR